MRALRVEPPTNRPQQPVRPFPYISEDVTYPSGTIALAGTLTRPEGDGPFTALVMITGSGPQDRDETVVGHKPFLLLADTLTRAGYAVLRVDDRGVGGSGGDLAQAGYLELADDVLAGAAYLRTRPEVDPARIGLFGHSQGGSLAPLAARRAGGGIAFVILMAGPAVPGDEVLLEQNRLIYAQAGQPTAAVESQLEFIRELARLINQGDHDAAITLSRTRITEQVAALPIEQRPSAGQVAVLARATVTPSLHALLTYDPAPALTALTVPVLAFYGGTDLQVSAAQNEPAMREHLAGNPDATVRTLPGLNHLMQPSPTGAAADYATIETTLAPEVLDLVTAWLKERF